MSGAASLWRHNLQRSSLWSPNRDYKPHFKHWLIPHDNLCTYIHFIFQIRFLCWRRDTIYSHGLLSSMWIIPSLSWHSSLFNVVPPPSLLYPYVLRYVIICSLFPFCRQEGCDLLEHIYAKPVLEETASTGPSVGRISLALLSCSSWQSLARCGCKITPYICSPLSAIRDHFGSLGSGEDWERRWV